MISEHYTAFLRQKLAANEYEFVWQSLRRVGAALEGHSLSKTITILTQLAGELPEQRQAFEQQLHRLHALITPPVEVYPPFMEVKMQLFPIDSSEMGVVCGEFCSRG